jgi:hypothetical protein
VKDDVAAVHDLERIVGEQGLVDVLHHEAGMLVIAEDLAGRADVVGIGVNSHVVEVRRDPP